MFDSLDGRLALTTTAFQLQIKPSLRQASGHGLIDVIACRGYISVLGSGHNLVYIQSEVGYEDCGSYDSFASFWPGPEKVSLSWRVVHGYSDSLSLSLP